MRPNAYQECKKPNEYVNHRNCINSFHVSFSSFLAKKRGKHKSAKKKGKRTKNSKNIHAASFIPQNLDLFVIHNKTIGENV